MGETIKTGGSGKNPAINKVNQLQAITNRIQAASELKRRAFSAPGKAAGEERKRRERIIRQFDLHFRKKRKAGQMALSAFVANRIQAAAMLKRRRFAAPGKAAEKKQSIRELVFRFGRKDVPRIKKGKNWAKGYFRK